MASEPLRVLLIQSWVVPGGEVRDALRSAGFHAQLTRVDFEPALAAALSRGSYDIVILDSQTSGLSLSLVEGLLKEHGVRTPLVELQPGQGLGDRVRMALLALRN